jgi:hypothetical protein
MIRNFLGRASGKLNPLAGVVGRAGVPTSGVGRYGNVRAKGLIDCGEPLSALAIVAAAPPSSANSREHRGSACSMAPVAL